MRFRVGTSGWNYPTGKGTWNGIFYPLPEDRERGFDELRFYAERFNTVEVNSTFYGQPRPNVTLGWVRRTPGDFDFSIKLYQKFTHPGMALRQAQGHPDPSRAPGSSRASSRDEQGRGVATDPGPVTQADVDAFKGGIEPLAAAGRLGVLLAQFPPSFQRTPEAEDYLAWLLRTFSQYSMAVELRHRSWSDVPAATLALLEAQAAAWVQIDEPKFESSIRQDLRPNGDELFYVRLHGRNAAQWWEHELAEDRYNYLYAAAELAPIAQKARDARALVKKAYLYMNNHFSAQSVANAVTLRKMLDEPVTARMPAELVERFPDLAGVPTLPRARLL